MSVEERITKIQEAFQIGKLEGELKGVLSEYQFEAALTNEYVSVAFEGCSMAIAIKSLKNRDSLIDWHLFVSQRGQNYLSQIHVGLGWALAELQLPIQQYLISIDPKWQLRVLDGFGYYCGLFRRREAIRTMSFPSEVPEELYAGYNQGIGRILFYLAQGNVERLVRNIELCSDDRHSDFWRGIGIAATFIGALDQSALEEMEKAAGENNKQLVIGVALATNSLKKANAIDDTSSFVSHYLLKNNLELNNSIVKIENLHFHSIKSYLESLFNA